MLSTHFYHATSRKLVVAVGNMFNNITLIRRKADGDEHQRWIVPIEYGPKQKWWTVMQEDPTNIKRTRMLLPRIAFEITNIIYDSSRKLNLITRMSNATTDNSGSTRKTVYTGTPYIYQMEVSVMALNSDDGFQIIEQIVPFFAPTFTVTINSIPEIGHKEDIPITLVSVAKNDEYEGSFERIRLQTWNLSFTARAHLYGPVRDSAIIRKVQVDTHVVGGNGPVTAEEIEKTPRHIRITVEPDPIDAEPNGDYGFSVDITEYDDNKKFDPVTGLDVDLPGNTSIYPEILAATISLPEPVVTAE